jgi:hypothetical protein
MAGLGLGLGISSGVNGPGHDAGGVTDALYFLTQDDNVLITQRKRGSPLSDAFLVVEPNDGVIFDTLPEPTQLLLLQDGGFLLTQDGRILAQNIEDLPFTRLMSQDDKNILTQDDNFLVSQQVS